MEIASTIQSASINRAPSPSHDLNPSTAASQKQPVSLSHSDPSLDKYAYDSEGIDGSDLEDGEEDIPYSVLKPVPRRQSFGPLPDLRFEQSYLASIAGADSNWKVAYITLRDQVSCRYASQRKNVYDRARADSVYSWSFPSSKAWSGPSRSKAGDTGTGPQSSAASQ